MIALVDGDIVCYRCACSCEDIPTLAELAAMGKDIDDREALIVYEPIEVAFKRVDELMEKIALETKSNRYEAFLSGEHDFRLLVNPDYKANRKDTRRPRYLQQVREYLVTEWNAKVTDGIEADDALGIYQTNYMKDGHESVICTIDKDLQQIAGWNYNFVTSILKYISPLEGKQAFWRSMLIGDKTDNIIGVEGIGEKKSAKLINHLTTDEEMYQVVYELYNNHERFQMNFRCLTILTEEL